jgi:NTE family protein
MIPNSPSSITVVLSGGGAKATAHIGAIRALRASGLEPTRYIGTSMGGVVGAALAAGLTAEAVLERARSIRRHDVARLSAASLAKGLFATSLLHGEPLQRTIERFVPVASFASLRLPLTVTTADLDSGELVTFGDGGADAPLVTALCASCALPLWFPPVVWEGRRLADGGLRGVLPLQVAARFPTDLVVAIDAGPGLDSVPTEGRLAPPPLIRTHNDAVGVLMSMNTELELANWRLSTDRPPLLYVRPIVAKGATFALHEMERYEEAGYRATMDALAAGQPG